MDRCSHKMWTNNTIPHIRSQRSLDEKVKTEHSLFFQHKKAHSEVESFLIRLAWSWISFLLGQVTMWGLSISSFMSYVQQLGSQVSVHLSCPHPGQFSAWRHSSFITFPLHTWWAFHTLSKGTMRNVAHNYKPSSTHCLWAGKLMWPDLSS